jgi:hypothetical protein
MSVTDLGTTTTTHALTSDDDADILMGRPAAGQTITINVPNNLGVGTSFIAVNEGGAGGGALRLHVAAATDLYNDSGQAGPDYDLDPGMSVEVCRLSDKWFMCRRVE